MIYTKTEQVENIFIYGSTNRCELKTVPRFNDPHYDENVDHSYAQKLVAKFEGTNFFCRKQREGEGVACALGVNIESSSIRHTGSATVSLKRF